MNKEGLDSLIVSLDISKKNIKNLDNIKGIQRCDYCTKVLNTNEDGMLPVLHYLDTYFCNLCIDDVSFDYNGNITFEHLTRNENQDDNNNFNEYTFNNEIYNENYWENSSENSFSNEDNYQNQIVINSNPSQINFDDAICCICQSEKPNIVLDPCGHLCLCNQCSHESKSISECPICRSFIKKRSIEAILTNYIPMPRS